MRSFILAAVVVTFGAMGIINAQQGAATGAHRLAGEGVADLATNIGYFPNTTGGIDALDLTNGKVLWSSKDADRPLVATDNRLFALTGKTNQIRLIVLDIKDGKRILESEPIVMPDWVSVSVAYGRMFHSNARTDGKSVWLNWEARAFYAGGARPTPEVEEAARKHAQGVARVDLETGKIETLKADKPFQLDKLEPKVGNLTLTITDTAAKKAGNPFARQRMLRTFDDAMNVAWEREIAAPVVLPPRP